MYNKSAIYLSELCEKLMDQNAFAMRVVPKEMVHQVSVCTGVTAS